MKFFLYFTILLTIFNFILRLKMPIFLNKKNALVIFFIIIINSTAKADIYSTNCNIVEKQNKIKNITFVFSFNRENIVISRIDNKQVKYKLKIIEVHDKEKLIFDATDGFYTLNFKPGYSFIKKDVKITFENLKPELKLIDETLSSLNLKCSNPRIIKKEKNAEIQKIKKKLPNKIDETGIQKIFEKLLKDNRISDNDSKALLKKLKSSGASTQIKPEQLMELLKSRSFIGRLATKENLEKFTSKDFLEEIKKEYKKLTNQ